VTADFSHSQADFGCLIASLMGPMAAGEAPPVWPLNPEGSGDERTMAILVKHLGLDWSGYQLAIGIAAARLDWHAAKAAHALLCQALHRVPVITGDQLRELLGPHLLARLQHEEQPEEAASAA
jgi:hypothetical protein